MDNWKLYRTRFLSKAKRLDQVCHVTDNYGRVQEGLPGDYLVKGSDDSLRIVPAHVFEDIYTEFEAAEFPLNSSGAPCRRPRV